MTAVTAAPGRSETNALRALLPQLAPFLGILAVAMILPFVSNDYWALIGTRAAIYWVLVSGLNLVVGFAGHLAIGYVALLTLGAYTTSVLVAGNVLPPVPVFAALAIAGGVGAAFGVIVDAARQVLWQRDAPGSVVGETDQGVSRHLRLRSCPRVERSCSFSFPARGRLAPISLRRSRPRAAPTQATASTK